MEELCRSIGHQNATILTGRSAGPTPSAAHVVPSCQQPYADRSKNLEDQEKMQDGTDDVESSIETNDSEEDRNYKAQEFESADGSFTEELSAYIPKDSVMMKSIRNRKPQGLLINERYTVGCRVHSLEGGILRDMSDDSKSSTGSALIIQDINQDWAEILRSEFPKSVQTTFLAEHMVRLDETSVTEASMRQVGTEIINVCPHARMKVTHFNDECIAVDFGFPFQLPKHEGVHVDFLFDTMERVPMDYSFLHGTRQTVYEKDASKQWRRASHRISWCKLAEQFRKAECLSLDVFACR